MKNIVAFVRVEQQQQNHDLISVERKAIKLTIDLNKNLNFATKSRHVICVFNY